MNKALALALIAAAAVQSCASSENARAARDRNPAPCPNAIVLEDAARLIKFEGDPDLENIAWTAEIEDISLSCRYYGDQPIEAEMELRLAFGRGPAATDDEHEFQYFVAVTRTDMEVIAKETFVTDVDFGGSRAIKRDKFKVKKIVIPRAGEGIAGTNFEIVVGMVLTREQALYNRSGKSLKFPEL